MAIRITKEMATKAAEKMASKIYDAKRETQIEEIREHAEALLQLYVPAPVIAVVKEYSGWFYTCNRIGISYINEQGYRSNTIYAETITNIPSDTNRFTVTKSEFEAIGELRQKVTNLDREKVKYITDVTDALFNLRTPKNVEKVFPEALPYLDIPSEAGLPAPQHQQLRDLFNASK